ncbi:hypothetical protein ACFE04_016401 [Oxalis oulophora]
MDVLFLANGISSSESRWNKDKKKYEDKAIDEMYKVVVPYDFPVLEVAGMKMGDSVGRVFMCIVKSVHAVISLFGQTKEQLKEDDEDDDDDAATEKPTRFDDRKDENHRDAGNSNSQSQVNHSSYSSTNLISKATVNRKLIILPTPQQILYQRNNQSQVNHSSYTSTNLISKGDSEDVSSKGDSEDVSSKCDSEDECMSDIT